MAISSPWLIRCGARLPGSIRMQEASVAIPMLFIQSAAPRAVISTAAFSLPNGRQGLPPDILKGAVMGSGMYDLKPVRLSKRSAFVKFTDEMEEELSAMRHLDKIHTPIVLAHGS